MNSYTDKIFFCRAVADIKKTAGTTSKVELFLCDLTVSFCIFLLQYFKHVNVIMYVLESPFVCCRSIKEMVELYKKTGYPLHVLVNNAAIQAPKGHRGEHTKDNIKAKRGWPTDHHVSVGVALEDECDTCSATGRCSCTG